MNNIVKNSIVRNIILLLKGNILASLIGLFNTMILVNSIGLENNGIIFMAQSYVMLFNTLFNFQSYSAIIMAYKVIILYRLYMPSYFLGTPLHVRKWEPWYTLPVLHWAESVFRVRQCAHTPLPNSGTSHRPRNRRNGR